jgi:hypothetical protein
MPAALEVNIPNCANAVVTTNEVVVSISSLRTTAISPQPKEEAHAT